MWGTYAYLRLARLSVMVGNPNLIEETMELANNRRHLRR